ncbi:MAG: PH domain-containing protein [Haloarculaceae archaeon]
MIQDERYAGSGNETLKPNVLAGLPGSLFLGGFFGVWFGIFVGMGGSVVLNTSGGDDMELQIAHVPNARELYDHIEDRVSG